MATALFWVQLATTIIIAFTFVVYFLQLRAMRSASTAQNILAVISHLQEPQVREARRVVLTELRNKPLASWGEEEKRLASLVYSTYDIAGILIKSGLVPRDLFIDNWGRVSSTAMTFLNRSYSNCRRRRRVSSMGSISAGFATKLPSDGLLLASNSRLQALKSGSKPGGRVGFQGGIGSDPIPGVAGHQTYAAGGKSYIPARARA